MGLGPPVETLQESTVRSLVDSVSFFVHGSIDGEISVLVGFWQDVPVEVVGQSMLIFKLEMN